MQNKEQSKLQIRAEVLSILQQYTCENDIKPSKQKQDIETLKNITERVFVVEVLLKEFLKSTDFKRRVISVFLSNLVVLKDVEEILWDFLKNPKISDRIKEDIIFILRNLGARINTDELLGYLENPDELIDKETQNLLETAKLNPEAQIDFLDFLFALKPEEQIQLINTLKEDYSGDDLANILTPALQANLDPFVQHTIIEILGTTKSYLAVEPLMLLNESVNEENTKKLAKKSLNLLKLSGINLEDKAKMRQREEEVCKLYEIYEAYASLPDGTGSQGIILGRIKDNQIYMFSTVINEKEGIVDCFGFSKISKEEFHKIIDRFTQNAVVIKVPPEYCKSKLEKAENINRINKIPVSYEYLCWKIYIADVNMMDKNIEDAFSFNQIELSNENYEKLYKSGDFDTWFFEYDDEPEVTKILNFVIDKFNSQNKSFITQLDKQIDEAVKNIASEDWQNSLYLRLMDCAYLYGLNNKEKLKNISASIGVKIKTSPVSNFTNIKFITDIIRRSILQFAGNCLEEEEEAINIKKTRFATAVPKNTKPKLDFNSAISLLNYLEEYWK
jgi:hypothetical protein